MGFFFFMSALQQEGSRGNSSSAKRRGKEGEEAGAGQDGGSYARDCVHGARHAEFSHGQVVQRTGAAKGIGEYYTLHRRGGEFRGRC